MGPRDAPPGMPGQQQPVLLHQSVDPLGVDGIEAGGSPLALEERGDPPVPIARPAIDQASNIGREFCVSSAVLGTALRTLIGRSLNQVGTSHFEGLSDPLYGISSGACDRDSKVGFFTRARSSASLRISTSMVLRPSRRSRSRTRSSSRRTSDAAITSSSARTASLPPSLISRLHRKTRLGESPCRRAT